MNLSKFKIVVLQFIFILLFISCWPDKQSSTFISLEDIMQQENCQTACRSNNYPTKSLRSTEEVIDIETSLGTDDPDIDVYTVYDPADSTFVLNQRGAVKVKRKKLKAITDRCGCPLPSSKHYNYYMLVGVKADGTELLGDTNFVARPCPPFCYTGN